MEPITFNAVKHEMEGLGTYRTEFDTMIKIYVGLVEQYADIQNRLNRTGALQTKSAQGGFKKSPIVTAAENLRRDILQYSDRLCLNPKALSLSGIPAPKKEGTLARVIRELEEEVGIGNAGTITPEHTQDSHG